MSMTDQERAGMLAKGFQAMADGKQVEWFISDTVTEAFWSKDPVGQMQIGHEVLHFRILPNTITATVTIPKPLKEWPVNNANVWVVESCRVLSISSNSYNTGIFRCEMECGAIYDNEKNAQTALAEIKKLRLGHLA